MCIFPALTQGEGGIISTVKPFTSALAYPASYSPDVPANAIDAVGGAANLTTFTWSGFTSPTNSLAFSFNGPELINRIRLWKDDASGTGGINFDGAGGVVKDWTLYYTTSSTATALNLRTWIPVTGLTNGFGGTELLHLLGGGSVNDNGTVVGDIHDSVNEGDGFASLSFNPVLATGLRIEYANNAVITSSPVNYFKVHDARAFLDEIVLTPEPNAVVLFGMVAVFGAAVHWYRRQSAQSLKN